MLWEDKKIAFWYLYWRRARIWLVSHFFFWIYFEWRYNEDEKDIMGLGFGPLIQRF